MRAIAGSILILAAVVFHRSPAAFRPLGFCLLWLIVLLGAWYLLSDLPNRIPLPQFGSFVVPFWRWLLNGRNFLVKGTVVGAVAGALASLVLFGPSQVGNLAAIPGAFIGLVLGLTLDSIAHRHRYRQPPQPAALDESNRVTDPLRDD